MSTDYANVDATANQQEQREHCEESRLVQCARTSRAKFEQCVNDHPTASILASLAAGVAVGVAIGGSLSRRSEVASWRTTSAELGRKVMEAVNSAVPDAIRRG